MWSDGIYLLGQYNNLRTGCWLLTHGQSGVILELPPYGAQQTSPVTDARLAVRDLGIDTKYLLCSHLHGDHVSAHTANEFRRAFPHAQMVLQRGFQGYLRDGPTRYFDDDASLSLDGEPLFLIHAPKHSWTDTIVIFRGVAIMGDWELNTIRSVHDGHGRYSVPDSRKLESIEKLIEFPRRHTYNIHKVFSVHANDKREDVDFAQLLQDTKVDRKLW
ncbi:MAG: MBL fold metallo-hydrolase [Chloroflexota bacterium]|nr:MBL fold metallo-hydrolase [Chloroflexota bacterium]